MSKFNKMSIIKKNSAKVKKQAPVNPKLDLSFDKENCDDGLTCSCCVKINMFEPGFEEKWQKFVEESNGITKDDEIIK